MRAAVRGPTASASTSRPPTRGEGRRKNPDSVRCKPSSFAPVRRSCGVTGTVDREAGDRARAPSKRDASTVVPSPVFRAVTRNDSPRSGDDVKRGDPLFEIDPVPKWCRRQTDSDTPRCHGQEKRKAQLALAKPCARPPDRPAGPTKGHLDGARSIRRRQDERPRIDLADAQGNVLEARNRLASSSGRDNGEVARVERESAAFNP